MMSMSIEDAHISTEDRRIMRRIAATLIAEEMRFVREELEMLRADMNKSYANQLGISQNEPFCATHVPKRP